MSICTPGFLYYPSARAKLACVTLTRAVDRALEGGLRRLQTSDREIPVVIVTGVGGTDSRTSQHKHRSHTKGGTVDRAVLEALAPGRPAAALLSSRKATPLYTSATHSNNVQGKAGDGNKFYGSYLVMLKQR